MTKLRSIKTVHTGKRDDIDNLVTRQVLPTPSLRQIDPFLFLAHHGPQNYPPANSGLPFGPHPHRGFETLTVILDGDVAHKDSTGHESVIQKNGVQWMTAGRGIVHEEVSSKEFLTNGGPLELLQLWINLPSRLKMTAPKYIGKQSHELPVVEVSGLKLHLISGNWQNTSGPIPSLTDVFTSFIEFAANSKHELTVPKERNIFFYVVRGSVKANGQEIHAYHLAEFNLEEGGIEVSSTTGAMVFFCHALPIGEPVVAQGPFVMNTREEIQTAIRDYHAGRFN